MEELPDRILRGTRSRYMGILSPTSTSRSTRRSFMKTCTVDANVIIKWIFPEKEGETDTVQALNLLNAI
jgi:hypothetical protein